MPRGYGVFDLIHLIKRRQLGAQPPTVMAGPNNLSIGKPPPPYSFSSSSSYSYSAFPSSRLVLLVLVLLPSPLALLSSFPALSSSPLPPAFSSPSAWSFI